MSCIKICHDSDDWLYDLEQINKERNLTRREYKQYQVLTRIRDEHYAIHLKEIEKLRNNKVGINPDFKHGNKRLWSKRPTYGGMKL